MLRRRQSPVIAGGCKWIGCLPIIFLLAVLFKLVSIIFNDDDAVTLYIVFFILIAID
jgi:hypothetical protein